MYCLTSYGRRRFPRRNHTHAHCALHTHISRQVTHSNWPNKADRSEHRIYIARVNPGNLFRFSSGSGIKCCKSNSRIMTTSFRRSRDNICSDGKQKKRCKMWVFEIVCSFSVPDLIGNGFAIGNLRPKSLLSTTIHSHTPDTLRAPHFPMLWPSPAAPPAPNNTATVVLIFIIVHKILVFKLETFLLRRILHLIPLSCPPLGLVSTCLCPKWLGDAYEDFKCLGKPSNSFGPAFRFLQKVK